MFGGIVKIASKMVKYITGKANHPYFPIHAKAVNIRFTHLSFSIISRIIIPSGKPMHILYSAAKMTFHTSYLLSMLVSASGEG